MQGVECSERVDLDRSTPVTDRQVYDPKLNNDELRSADWALSINGSIPLREGDPTMNRDLLGAAAPKWIEIEAFPPRASSTCSPSGPKRSWMRSTATTWSPTPGRRCT